MKSSSAKILEAAQYGLIDYRTTAKPGFSPQLIINDNKKGLKVITQIEYELSKANSFWFSVAFITYSGINVLLETLKEAQKKGIKGKILTTNYLTFSEPKALERLLEFDNLEVKIYDNSAFHIKGYMFEHTDTNTLFVGSSNLTQSALLNNKEWNVKLTGQENGALVKKIDSEFNSMWKEAIPLTKEWIDDYKKLYEKTKKIRSQLKTLNINTLNLTPNIMQKKAVQALKQLRSEGKEKAILISATGTGKTYLAAFDVKEANPNKMLFLAHREQLLSQAQDSFKTVLGPEIDTGILSGRNKDIKAKYLFSTMNMMAKEEIQNKFLPDEFDYIIIDEAHRSASKSYQSILKYFNPKFLFGMTATPSRTDSKDVLGYFDRNIALRISLQQAMESDLLCPFHYFGISEIYVEGKLLDDNSEFRHLTSSERVNNIVDKIKFYGYSGDRVKGLIFCSRIEEAEKLSRQFNYMGFRTKALSGSNSQDERIQALNLLEQDERGNDGFDYLFTVDIFNEGVDIPSVNQVILLRPTQSAVIFIQQLGRGLRKWEDKEFVVVLDFIGNYDKNYNIPMALSGDKSCNKDTIRKSVSDGTKFLPGCSTIVFDNIAKQQIYTAIDSGSFGKKKDIKIAYNILKSELAHSPSFDEFVRNGDINMNRIFDLYGSYYELVKDCEKDKFSYTFNSEELSVLNYLSKKIGKGKHYFSISLLRQLVNYSHFDSAAEELPQYNLKSKETAYKVLTHSYNTVSNSPKCKKIHEACLLAKKENNSIYPTDMFLKYLKNNDFKKGISEILEYSEQQYRDKYINKYKDSNMTIFEKYSYEDVCKSLNWEKDESATIGGYKYNEKTNTLPVFINYEKNINAINYHDNFKGKDILLALSKKQRKIGCLDWEHIYKSKENNTKIYLFVRKNTTIEGAKDFFFLGEISPIGRAKDAKIDNKNAFEIIYKLETPVRDDIYEYFTLAD